MRHDLRIEDYRQLDLTGCYNMGFFVPNALVKGNIVWRRDGEVTGSISFSTDLRSKEHPTALLSYTYNGREINDVINLKWQRSNLNERLNGVYGYYYFVCPVTGVKCRKLYLRGGRFISRTALGALYDKQTESKRERNSILNKVIEAELEFDTLMTENYKKRTYRGKLTPFGRKLAKANNRVIALRNYIPDKPRFKAK